MSDRLNALSEAGVSIWLDDLSRERIETGNLADLVKNKHVVGVTTNPSIFASARPCSVSSTGRAGSVLSTRSWFASDSPWRATMKSRAEGSIRPNALIGARFRRRRAGDQ